VVKEQVNDPDKKDKRYRSEKDKCGFYIHPKKIRAFCNENVIQGKPGIAVIEIHGYNMPRQHRNFCKVQMGDDIGKSKKERIFQLQSKNEISQHTADFEQNTGWLEIITEDLDKNHAEKCRYKSKIIPGSV
jgi:hypothetical protein